MSESSGTSTIVVGVMPSPFQPGDASAVVGLAAAAVAAMAAFGNDDPKLALRALEEAAQTLMSMRPEAIEAIKTAAGEMIEAMQAGKTFVVLASFQAPPNA